MGMASLGIPAWRIFLAGPVLRMAYSLATNPSSRKERVVIFALDMFGPNIAKKALNKVGLPYYLVRFGVPFVWNLWRHRNSDETIKCIALDTFISVVFDELEDQVFLRVWERIYPRYGYIHFIIEDSRTNSLTEMYVPKTMCFDEIKKHKAMTTNCGVGKTEA